VSARDGGREKELTGFGVKKKSKTRGRLLDWRKGALKEAKTCHAMERKRGSAEYEGKKRPAAGRQKPGGKQEELRKKRRGKNVTFR